MIQLDTSEYDKLNKLLSKVTINNLFARAVIEKRVSGSVYVDNKNNPKSCYVVHPYGMSLLFGVNHNNKFNTAFVNYVKNKDGNRTKDNWMQTYPAEWDKTLKTLFKQHKLISNDQLPKLNQDKVEVYKRVNFKFNLEKYLHFRETIQPENFVIKQSEKGIYTKMKGSVVPSYFWDNENDFFQNGIAFSLYVEEKLATTAFSAFVHDSKLELGIETIEDFRGKGYAQLVCSCLIDYCLANNYKPIWACNSSNTGSYKLAQKLGFEHHQTIPYYKLNR
ncbi:MAG: GNAT family N-acetyltransferase [Marinifilaceae bacterium]